MIVDIGFASNIEAFPYFYHSTIQQSALFIIFLVTHLLCVPINLQTKKSTCRY